ncbi:MAG: DUF6644 family protein [Pseudomonadales bacterium]
MDLLFLFEWIDTSMLAELSKAYGGVFAVVQTFHLGAMVLLGGMILVGDLRLLNIVMADVPAHVVLKNTERWVGYALIVVIFSGIFMMSAVAIKLYYNMFFLSKMVGLFMGVSFFYFIRKPLLNTDHSDLSPWSIKIVAIASILIWFSVAASGRWIGFS